MSWELPGARADGNVIDFFRTLGALGLMLTAIPVCAGSEMLGPPAAGFSASVRFTVPAAAELPVFFSFSENDPGLPWVAFLMAPAKDGTRFVFGGMMCVVVCVPAIAVVPSAARTW